MKQKMPLDTSGFASIDMRFVCVKRALMEDTFADSLRMLSHESVQPMHRKPEQRTITINRARFILCIGIFALNF